MKQLEGDADHATRKNPRPHLKGRSSRFVGDLLFSNRRFNTPRQRQGYDDFGAYRRKSHGEPLGFLDKAGQSSERELKFQKR